MLGFMIIMTWLGSIHESTTPQMIEGINLAQQTLARQYLPGLMIFVAAIITLGILLWIKARDLELLSRQGFFSQQ